MKTKSILILLVSLVAILAIAIRIKSSFNLPPELESKKSFITGRLKYLNRELENTTSAEGYNSAIIDYTELKGKIIKYTEDCNKLGFKNNNDSLIASIDNRIANLKNDLNGFDSVESTEDCLVGYDWVFPSGKNPIGAWKFISDGTFNSSTKMFGGMSTWGNWMVVSPGKIKIIYTRTTEGVIPDDQTLTMSACNNLLVGTTLYIKK